MPPANDNFADALTITGLGGITAPVEIGGATSESPDGPFMEADVWYKFTPPTTGSWMFWPIGRTVSGFQAVEVIFEDVAWPDYDLADNAIYGNGKKFELNSGTDYFIQLGTLDSGDSGQLRLLWFPVNPTGGEGVSFNPELSTLEISDPDDPTWARLDAIPSLIRSWSVRRGRQDELSKIPAGAAQIEVNDVHGIFDPTNPLGPFEGFLDPLKQVALNLWNPVDNLWVRQFTGFVEEFGATVDGSQAVAFIEIPCVDLFEIIAGVEVAPGGAFGQALPDDGSVDGNVFYEDASPGPQVRIEGALTQADIPSALFQINTGNVSIQETVYSPGTSTLTICQDGADSEFPGLGLLWVRKDGVVRFTGRQPRFRPEVVEYDIDVFKAGDGAAIAGDATIAQIRALGWLRGKEAIINAALATPLADEAEYTDRIDAQIVTDGTSITRYGVRPWSAENLLTDTGIATGNDKWEETKLFAAYRVANQKDPQTRINRIGFRSLRPEDARADATWNLICNAEINDIIRLTVTHPGGGGFDEDDHFVEGLDLQVEPAGADWASATLELDVTPRANYNTNPFDGDPDP